MGEGGARATNCGGMEGGEGEHYALFWEGGMIDMCGQCVLFTIEVARDC